MDLSCPYQLAAKFLRTGVLVTVSKASWHVAKVAGGRVIEEKRIPCSPEVSSQRNTLFPLPACARLPFLKRDPARETFHSTGNFAFLLEFIPRNRCPEYQGTRRISEWTMKNFQRFFPQYLPLCVTIRSVRCSHETDLEMLVLWIRRKVNSTNFWRRVGTRGLYCLFS